MRTSVPALPGSVTSSSTSTRPTGVRPSNDVEASASGTRRATAISRLGRDRVGHLGRARRRPATVDVLVLERPRTATAPPDRSGARGVDEDGLDGEPGVERVGDQRRALDDERPASARAPAAPREAPQLLNVRVARRQRPRDSGRWSEPSRLTAARRRLGGHLDQGGERRRVGDGEVGEDLAVDLDLGRLAAR